MEISQEKIEKLKALEVESDLKARVADLRYHVDASELNAYANGLFDAMHILGIESDEDSYFAKQIYEIQAKLDARLSKEIAKELQD